MSRIMRVYKIVLALLLVLTLLLVSALCVNIYLQGDKPFTKEAISDAFRIALPVLFITLSAIIGGFVIGVFSEEENKNTAKVQSRFALAAVKKRFYVSNGEEKKRRIINIIFYCLYVVISLFPLTYLCNGKNFTIENLNSDIVSATIVVMIHTAVLFAFAFLRIYLYEKSIFAELEIYKKAIKEKTAVRCEVLTSRKSNDAVYIRCALIFTAVVLIVLGIFNDGIGDVYGKAVRICTECIGLG